MGRWGGGHQGEGTGHPTNMHVMAGIGEGRTRRGRRER
jgi:hypothetical protein